MKRSHSAQPLAVSGLAFAAVAVVLSLALNATALGVAWSNNLAYLRLDVLLNRPSGVVTWQSAATAADWPPAAAPAGYIAAYGLGLTHNALRQYPQALAAFQAALAADPQNSDAHALLGDVYHALGNEAGAVAEWQAAQALPLLVARGDNSSRAGDWQAAEAWYLLATRVDPQSAPAFWRLGRAYVAAGAGQPAIAALLQAVSLAPGDVAIRHALGLAYLQQQAFAEAEAQFQRVLAEAPDDFYTNLYLVSTELALGRPAVAETYARTVTRLAPTDPRAHYALGSVLARQAQWTAAIAELRSALSLVAAWNRQSTAPLSPADQAGYHLLLARTYQSAAQTQAAIGEFQAVLQLDPLNAAARAALKTLQPSSQP